MWAFVDLQPLFLLDIKFFVTILYNFWEAELEMRENFPFLALIYFMQFTLFLSTKLYQLKKLNIDEVLYKLTTLDPVQIPVHGKNLNV